MIELKIKQKTKYSGHFDTFADPYISNPYLTFKHFYFISFFFYLVPRLKTKIMYSECIVSV